MKTKKDDFPLDGNIMDECPKCHIPRPRDMLMSTENVPVSFNPDELSYLCDWCREALFRGGVSRVDFFKDMDLPKKVKDKIAEVEAEKRKHERNS